MRPEVAKNTAIGISSIWANQVWSQLVASPACGHTDLPSTARLSQLPKGKEHCPMDQTSKSSGCQRQAGASLLIVPTTNKILLKMDWAAPATTRKGETGRVQAASTAHLAMAKLCTCFQATLYFPFPLSPLLGFCALSKHLSTSSRLPAAIPGLSPRPSWGGEVPLASCQNHIPADQPWPITHSSWFAGQLCLSH